MSLISASFKKRSASILDYQVDWATWLGTDTIATSAFAVGTGLTKTSESHTTTSGTVWLSAGTVGNTYEVKHTITTAGGRTDYRVFSVEVIE